MVIGNIPLSSAEFNSSLRDLIDTYNSYAKQITERTQRDLEIYKDRCLSSKGEIDPGDKQLCKYLQDEFNRLNSNKP